MGSDHTQILGCIHGNHADSHHGGHNGNPRLTSKRLHFLPGTGQHHAAAAADQRAFGLLNRGQGPFNLQTVSLGAGLIPHNVRHCRIGELPFHQALLHIHRHINQHRAGPSRGRNSKCFFKYPRQTRGVLYQITVLGERLTGTGHIRLLEYIAPQQFAAHLAGNRHQRDRIHIRRRQSGNQVGSPGARGDDTHAHLPAAAGIAAGLVSRILLLPYQHMTDVRMIKLIIERTNRRTGIPECNLYLFFLQTSHHDLRTADHPPSLPFLPFTPLKGILFNYIRPFFYRQDAD